MQFRYYKKKLRTLPFQANPHLYSCDFSILSCLSRFFLPSVIWGSVNNTFIYIISLLAGVECIFHKNRVYTVGLEQNYVCILIYTYTFMRVIRGSTATVTYTPPVRFSTHTHTHCTLQHRHPLIIHDLWNLRVVYYITQETTRIHIKRLGAYIYITCTRVQNVRMSISVCHPHRVVIPAKAAFPSSLYIQPTLIQRYNNTF